MKCSQSRAVCSIMESRTCVIKEGAEITPEGFLCAFRGFGQMSAFWTNCRENGQIVGFLDKMSGKWTNCRLFRLWIFVHFPDNLVKMPTFVQKADICPKPRKAKRKLSCVIFWLTPPPPQKSDVISGQPLSCKASVASQNTYIASSNGSTFNVVSNKAKCEQS